VHEIRAHSNLIENVLANGVTHPIINKCHRLIATSKYILGNDDHDFCQYALECPSTCELNQLNYYSTIFEVSFTTSTLALWHIILLAIPKRSTVFSAMLTLMIQTNQKLPCKYMYVRRRAQYSNYQNKCSLHFCPH